MEYSLMFPQNAEQSYKTLTPESVNDLSIEFLLDALTKQRYERDHIRKIVTRVTDDPEVIRYRCDVFEDFLRFPKLRDAMEELVVKLADLRDVERFQKDQEGSALWSLVNRLREIDDYVTCITAMKNVLDELDVRSEGMLTLRKIISDISADSGFPELRQDIDETFEKVRRIKSITIGVNLDNMLCPSSAGVVSLNDIEYRESSLMRRFMNFADRKDELHHGTDTGSIRVFHPATPVKAVEFSQKVELNDNMTGTRVRTSAVTGADSLSNAIKDTVTNIMKQTVNEIKNTIKRYVNISGYMLINLMPEILFYIRWAELIEKIMATGMPVCKAQILPPEKRDCSFKGLYNLKLAINKAGGEDINIITNDIDFNDDMRIFILTGPNRGGKTIFTQAWGIAMLLAQLGVYIPAESASVSPCDNIFTHFPADENDTVDLGRLGEESKRLSEIFGQATERSIMLLNESLATTSVTEGLFIAKDVVRAMRYLGTRCIFNTHMHDLARSVDALNEEVEGTSKAASLVTGVHDGERSFKVSLLPPQGISYAKDIALKYGVSFRQIKESIDNRTQ
ncbi:MutS-related protein [Ruminococcus sp.]|uniref:MutS-related protein n=1 Tax=Ruminococcus sp. TaxID=41978 RepID=UPI002E774932|nr:hypothetical protein [Ruminococcus sp.]MEE1263122.1 hypothetical protein [Ruminococcus sp.]